MLPPPDSPSAAPGTASAVTPGATSGAPVSPTESHPKVSSLIPPSGDHDAPNTLYETLIRPHRSLTRPGFIALLALYVAIAAVPALWFLSRGAWPVTGAFGLEGLLLWGAFRLNNRDRRRFEWIRLTESELVVTRGDAGGRMIEWRLEPTWLRVELVSTGGRVVRQTVLALTSHGKRLFIGGFLGLEQKEQLAKNLRTALAERMLAPRGSV